MENFRITTPGDLIANLPGLFGFYPSDSLVLLTFDKHPGSLRLGPVVRVDVADIEEPDNLRTAVELVGSTERILSAIVISRDLAAIDRATEILVEFARTDCWPIFGIWSLAQIGAGEPYELQYPALVEPPLREWEAGLVPEIMGAHVVQQMSASGELPELSRREALEYFTAPEDAADLTALSSQGATLLSAAIRGGGEESQAALDFLMDQAFDALEDAATADSSGWLNLEKVRGAEVVAAALSDSFLRDLILGVLLSHPGPTNTLMRSLAGSLSGSARANALCVFALSAYQAAKAHRMVGALAAARYTDPHHRLTQLIVAAQSTCDASAIASRVRAASLQTVSAYRFTPDRPAGPGPW